MIDCLAIIIADREQWFTALCDCDSSRLNESISKFITDGTLVGFHPLYGDFYLAL